MTLPDNDTPTTVSDALRDKITSANTPPAPPKPEKTGGLIPFPPIREFNETVRKIHQWGNQRRYVQSALKRREARLRRIGVSEAWIAADVGNLKRSFAEWFTITTEAEES